MSRNLIVLNVLEKARGVQIKKFIKMNTYWTLKYELF